MFVVGLVLIFYFVGAVLVKINNHMVDSEGVCIESKQHGKLYHLSRFVFVLCLFVIKVQIKIVLATITIVVNCIKDTIKH